MTNDEIDRARVLVKAWCAYFDDKGDNTHRIISSMLLVARYAHWLEEQINLSYVPPKPSLWLRIKRFLGYY